MNALWHHLRHSLRTLRRNPGFAAIAIVTLALGIGGNTAIYTVVDGLLFQSLPFEQGDRLVMLWSENQAQGRSFSEVAPAEARLLQEQARSFEIAPYDFASFVLTGLDRPEQVRGAVISQQWLPLLGVTPARGRNFLPEEDRSGGPSVALVSWEFWEQRLGADPAVLDRALTLDGRPTRIVGVLPADFRYEFPADVYAPLAYSEAVWQRREPHTLRVVGRLAGDVSLAEAASEVGVLMQAAEAGLPEAERGWRIRLLPAAEGLFQGPVRPGFLSLLGAVGFVLLIACADVANLLLARMTGRRRELAIRTSLGATRRRLVAQLMAETLVLASLGAVVGVVLAQWAVSAMLGALPAQVLDMVPRFAALKVDGSALLYTVLVTVVATILAGLIPALRAVRGDLRDALGEASTAATGGVARSRLRGALVTLEVTLALVLLTGAGLTARSFMSQLGANPGFQSERLLTLWLAAPETRYPDGAAIAALATNLEREIGNLPEVEAVAVANTVPLSGEGLNTEFSMPGREAMPGARPFTNLRLVSGDYFHALGIPVLEGRGIEPADAADGERVVVASRGFVARYFPGETAIGRTVLLEGDSLPRRIVGVVEDVTDWRTGNASASYLYAPFQQMRSRRMALIVRARVAPAALADRVRDAVAALDPDQPVYDVATLDEVLRLALFPQRMSTGLLGALALIALALAVVGIYGVVSQTVGWRRHELGIRMAVGAGGGEVVGMVLRQSLRPVGLGIVLGGLGSLVLTRGLASHMPGVSASDPTTFLATAILLGSAAVVAAWLPARRATTAAPVETLRHE